MQENQLLEGNVRSTLFRFAMPFLAASFLQFIYGAVDMAVVGQFCNPSAIVAVSNGAQIMQILTLMVVGFTTGITVLVGQYLGDNQRRRDMETTFSTSLWVCGALAAVLLVALVAGHRALISLIQVPDGAVEYARQYLLICSFGIPFIVGYNIIASTLRAIGDSRRPMIFVAFTAGLNIVADLFFVAVLRMEVAGTAIATMLAQAISFFLACSVLRLPQFPFNPKALKPDAHQARLLLRMGVPLGLQNLLTELSFLLITVIINLIGTNQSAAAGIVERAQGIGFLAASAFSSAVSAMTAQNIGARKPERARQAAISGVVFSMVFGAVFYLILRIFGHAVFRIFTPDEEVIAHGIQYFTIYGVDLILVGLVFCMNGFFSGCGKASFTMFNCLFATFLVRVPLSYLISILPGTTMLHLGIAAPAASAVQIILQLIYLRSGRWRQNTLTQS